MIGFRADKLRLLQGVRGEIRTPLQRGPGPGRGTPDAHRALRTGRTVGAPVTRTAPGVGRPVGDPGGRREAARDADGLPVGRARRRRRPRPIALVPLAERRLEVLLLAGPGEASRGLLPGGLRRRIVDDDPRAGKHRDAGLWHPRSTSTSGYVFPYDRNNPRVPQDDNPVGSYRTTFEVPADWRRPPDLPPLRRRRLGLLRLGQRHAGRLQRRQPHAGRVQRHPHRAGPVETSWPSRSTAGATAPTSKTRTCSA